jgi:hypothetical protein
LRIAGAATRAAVAALLLLAVDARGAAPEPFQRTENRPRCEHYTPLRQPFFGDLHVHTALSLDAATQSTRNRPADAYRFARGEEVGRNRTTGTDDRSSRARPSADFAAVTDHAEFSVSSVCQTPGATGYDSPACMIFRRWPRLTFLLNGRSSDDLPRYRFWKNPEACRAAAAGPWQEIRDAAAAAYDHLGELLVHDLRRLRVDKAAQRRNLHRNGSS